jgi:hypothetical protein
MNMPVDPKSLVATTHIQLSPLDQRLDRPPNRDDLPFFRKRRGQSANWWEVRPTGNYLKDLETGKKYAEQYLSHLTINAGPAMLVWIVGAMKNAPGRDKDRLDGIAVGFLTALAKMFQRSVGRLALARLALNDERAREAFETMWAQTNGSLVEPRKDQLNAGAEVSSTAEGRDEAIEAIENYWTAIRRWQKARDRKKRLQKKVPAELLREPRVVVGQLLHSNYDVPGDYLKTPIYAYSNFDIEQSVETDMARALSFQAGPSMVYRPKAKGAEKNSGFVEVMTDRAKKARPAIRAKYKKRLKEKLAELDADRQSLFFQQRQIGWRQLVEEEKEARTEVVNTRYEAVHAIPTTRAGATALLDFAYKAYRVEGSAKESDNPYGLSECYYATVIRNVSRFLRTH